MKHQILKSVACVALLSLVSVGAMALDASNGVDGYRDGMEFLDGKQWVNKGTDALEKQTKELTKQLDDGMSSITNGVKGLNANKILDLGGSTEQFQKMANDGAKSFKVLENLAGFDRAGTTGDKWLDEFYGSGVNKNLNQYLQGDLSSQLGGASSARNSAVDEYNDNAKETYIRAGIAKAIHDATGIDNGDLWMVDYVPSVAVGQVLVNKDEAISAGGGISADRLKGITAEGLGITQEQFDAIDWNGGLNSVMDKAKSSASSAAGQLTNEYMGGMNGLISAGENIKDAAMSMQDLSQMHKDFSFGDANEINDIGQKLMNNAQEEAGRMLSWEAMRFMNEDALSDMNDLKDSVPWIGAGIPTMDILNLIVGMYNVDSVYAATDQNATGKTDPISKTAGIQVGEFKSCVTSGKSAKECCTVVAAGEGQPAVAEGATSYEQCCVAMTGKKDCTPLAQQAKKECLEQQENIADGWKMCDISCKNTDFGDLIHKKMENGETKWDEALIDDLLEECGVGESDWVPSPTVLTSAELAAVVPETIKEGIVKR